MLVPSPPPQLTGSIRAARNPTIVVVTVAGEIDIATTPHFRTLLEEAVDTGRDVVVVDMAKVTFIDAAGLSALQHAALRLRSTGRQLEVDGASAQARWLLDVTGLTDLVVVLPAAAAATLAHAIAGGAEIPLARGVVDAALKLVVTMAQAVVAGADGVSITLPRAGQLTTVAASNDVVLEMDHDQYDSGEGPCLDAAIQGERFHIHSLDEEARWPAFVPRARARGIASIMSTPLMATDLPLGALNIYSRTPHAFAAHEQTWADEFAKGSAAVVLSAGLGGSSPVRQDQIHQALRSRDAIAVAQGVIVHRDRVTPDEAYAWLRTASRQTGRPMIDLSEELVLASRGGIPASTGADGSSRDTVDG